MPQAAALAYLHPAASLWMAISLEILVPPAIFWELVIPSLIVCWGIVELCFYCYMKYLVQWLNQPTTPVRCSDPDGVLVTVMAVVKELGDVYTPEMFIVRWCGAERIQDIRQGNLMCFLAWALFSSRVEDLMPRDYAQIRGMIGRLEVFFGMPIAPGMNHNIRTLRMTLEPLEVVHRPLIAYAAVSTLPQLLGHGWLRTSGFRKFKYMDTPYWYRASRQSYPRLPLVFFHGVSPGQCVYAGLTTLLADDRSAILVEISHISMTLGEFRAKTEDEVVQTVRGIVGRHQIRRFCAAGHSYGTIWAGWVIRSMREEVKQAVLLDPVCILLCLPTTPFNFLYKKVFDFEHHKGTRSERIKTFILDCAIYMVARELTIANAMRRQFWWHTKILHAEEIHCPAIIGLASEDRLLSADAIRVHIQKRCGHAKVMWWEGFAHGELLAKLEKQQELRRWMLHQEDDCYWRDRPTPVWEGKAACDRSKAIDAISAKAGVTGAGGVAGRRPLRASLRGIKKNVSKAAIEATEESMKRGMRGIAAAGRLRGIDGLTSSCPSPSRSLTSLTSDETRDPDSPRQASWESFSRTESISSNEARARAASASPSRETEADLDLVEAPSWCQRIWSAGWNVAVATPQHELLRT